MAPRPFADEIRRNQPRPRPREDAGLFETYLQRRRDLAPSGPAAAHGVERQVDDRTGMPGPLKAGLEHLSGFDLSDVRVHRDSPGPARLGALAYTQGRHIHVGPGQDEHLPHEGWHVVQQMAGRVEPTMEIQGALVNDDEALEREADVMGERAGRTRRAGEGLAGPVAPAWTLAPSHRSSAVSTAPVQLLRADQMVVDRRYRYTDSDSGQVREGRLTEIRGGGWYRFDNGRVRGAANVHQDLGAAGDVEMSDSDDSDDVEEAATIRSLFTDYLDERGVTDPGVRNVLVELNEEQINNYRQLGMLHVIRGDWTEYTSCLDTAERLFDLLGSAEDTESGDGRAAVVIPRLVADIGNRADSAVLYRIRFGATAHGFVLAIYHGRAEIIQSFAGAAGQSLAGNLESTDFTYTAEEIQGVLTHLVSADAGQRNDAQLRLFEGRIDAEREAGDGIGGVVPADVRGFRVRIDRRSLFSADDLRERIRGRIDAALRAFRGR